MQRTPKSGQKDKYSTCPDLSVDLNEEESSVRNINLRKRKNSEEVQLLEIKDSIMQSIREMMNSEIAEIKNQNTQIIQSNNEILKLLQTNATNYKEVTEKMKTLEIDNAVAMKRINELENQLDVIQKKIIKNVIEIRNIPKKANEDVKKLVKSIYNTLQIQETNDMNIYRKGNNNGPIVIEYHESTEKDTLLKAFKKYNASHKDNYLNTEKIGFGGDKSRIYISESLTSLSKKFLAAGRDLVKNGTFKYCWTSRGNVLLRKDEGKPPIVIKSLNQIKDLISI